MATKHFDLTDAELEEAIAAYYLWFHENAPGVKPVETGRLAELWREFDWREKNR